MSVNAKQEGNLVKLTPDDYRLNLSEKGGKVEISSGYESTSFTTNKDDIVYVKKDHRGNVIEVGLKTK